MSEPSVATVLVLFGTDHHPFDRLITWVEKVVADLGPDGPSFLVQHGFTVPPDLTVARARYVPFMAHGEIGDRLRQTAAVICHGGPATIADCRRAGLLPVVVPRFASHGEHVDDHQVLYSGRLGSDGLVRTVVDQDAFESELSQALRRPRAVLRETDDAAIAATIGTFAELVDAVVAAAEVRRPRGAARRPGSRRG